MIEVKCAVLLNLIATIHCKMEGYIVGGELASMTDFPYSAYLNVICVKDSIEQTGWLCGSSVLNQDILLTAAHCLDGCEDEMRIIISAGSSKRLTGHKTTGVGYIKHESYTDAAHNYDIGMVKMSRSVEFSSTLSRVAIMRHPPTSHTAQVAGWGLIDEDNMIQTDYLMKLPQVLWTRKDCMDVYGDLTEDVFCASSETENKYVSDGDSGSALVIRDYIQIGLVSFKIPQISRNLIVYTNVSFYHTWINDNAKKLYCNKQ